MILLSPAAIVAAQLDHFASPPTHAKLVSTHKMNAPTNDPELKTVAPDLTQKIMGTYMFGKLNGQTGEFERTARTPLITVLLDTNGTAVTSDAVVLAPFIPNPHASADINAMSEEAHNMHRKAMLRQNRASLAAQHIISPGVAPNPSQPWMSISVPTKRAWHFTDQDFDAAASIHEPKLEGMVV